MDAAVALSSSGPGGAPRLDDGMTRVFSSE